MAANPPFPWEEDTYLKLVIKDNPLCVYFSIRENTHALSWYIYQYPGAQHMEKLMF